MNLTMWSVLTLSQPRERPASTNRSLVAQICNRFVICRIVDFQSARRAKLRSAWDPMTPCQMQFDDTAQRTGTATKPERGHSCPQRAPREGSHVNLPKPQSRGGLLRTGMSALRKNRRGTRRIWEILLDWKSALRRRAGARWAAAEIFFVSLGPRLRRSYVFQRVIAGEQNCTCKAT